jgi:hypothetical protein
MTRELVIACHSTKVEECPQWLGCHGRRHSNPATTTAMVRRGTTLQQHRNFQPSANNGCLSRPPQLRRFGPDPISTAAPGWPGLYVDAWLHDESVRHAVLGARTAQPSTTGESWLTAGPCTAGRRSRSAVLESEQRSWGRRQQAGPMVHQALTSRRSLQLQFALAVVQVLGHHGTAATSGTRRCGTARRADHARRRVLRPSLDVPGAGSDLATPAASGDRPAAGTGNAPGNALATWH